MALRRSRARLVVDAILPGMLIALRRHRPVQPGADAVALGSAPAEQSGLAAGANDTFRQAGIAVGIAGLGALIPAGAAFGGSPQAYVDGLHDALWVGAAVASSARSPPRP